MKEEEINKIICPFCNEPFTAEMEAEFYYSTGSEWTGMYDESVTVEINAQNVKNLFIRKIKVFNPFYLDMV